MSCFDPPSPSATVVLVASMGVRVEIGAAGWGRPRCSRSDWSMLAAPGGSTPAGIFLGCGGVNGGVVIGGEV